MKPPGAVAKLGKRKRVNPPFFRGLEGKKGGEEKVATTAHVIGDGEKK